MTEQIIDFETEYSKLMVRSNDFYGTIDYSKMQHSYIEGLVCGTEHYLFLVRAHDYDYRDEIIKEPFIKLYRILDKFWKIIGTTNNEIREEDFELLLSMERILLIDVYNGIMRLFVLDGLSDWALSVFNDAFNGTGIPIKQKEEFGTWYSFIVQSEEAYLKDME